MKITVNVKKAIALLTSVIILLGVVFVPLESSAATPVQITVTNASGKAGDDVTVSVNITANSGLGAAEFLLKYDTTKLTYKSKAFGPAKGEMNGFNEDYQKAGNTGNSKTIYFAPVHTEGITAGGSMVDMVFTINSGWSGSTAIAMTITEFRDPVNYKVIEHNITNGSVTVGNTTTTTTTSGPSTTNPSVTTTAATISGEATTVTNAGQTTIVPVSVPVEEIIDVLGPDGDNWDRDFNNLNEEQKEKIEEHFADQGKPVEVTPDGVYYIETTAPETTSTEDAGADTGGSRLTKKVILISTLSAVGLILAVSLTVVYVSRKKKEQA